MDTYTKQIKRFDVLFALTGRDHRITNLLDRLIYWWQNSKINIEGHRWMTKPLPHMANEIGIPLRTLDRDLLRLKNLGLIEKQCFKTKIKSLYIRITDKLLNELGNLEK